MKKLFLSVIIALAAVSVAMAQTNPTMPGPGTPPAFNPVRNYNTALGADILGAHNGYGRGCVMCHAPHSGSRGNGFGVSSDPQNGMYALWGQDLTPYFSASLTFSGDGAGKYPVVLPPSGSLTKASDANTIILFCLSCHDGSLGQVGMMKGQTVEALPVVGGSAPTLLGAQKPSSGGAYSNDHPVGGYAVVGCASGGNLPSTPFIGNQPYTGAAQNAPPPVPQGTFKNGLDSSHNWDCTGGGTVPISWNSSNAMYQFTNVRYPASFWNGSSGKLALFGTVVTAVTCTTCHDQHSMTVYTNSNGSFSTMFFIRGQYAPSTGGNSVAQFCRNCHGGESNEMNGLLNVPTT